MTYVVRGEELALLDVDDLASLRRRDEQIGLAAEKGRNLQDVGDLGDRSRLIGFVNIRENWHVHAVFDGGEDPHAFGQSWPTEGATRRPVRLVERRLEDERHAKARGQRG